MGRTIIPAIPQAGPGLDPRVQSVLSPLKEIVETREGLRGDPLQRSVTLRDLVDFGLITRDQAVKAGG